jgi:hypothetical protein
MSTTIGRFPTTTLSTTTTTTSGSCVCPSTTLFLQALTNKLVDMTTSLKKQFEDLKTAAQPTGTTRGTILASITVKGTISFKQEYSIYLQRFGPPVDGIFDPLFLELIRAELKAGIII